MAEYCAVAVQPRALHLLSGAPFSLDTVKMMTLMGTTASCHLEEMPEESHSGGWVTVAHSFERSNLEAQRKSEAGATPEPVFRVYGEQVILSSQRAGLGQAPWAWPPPGRRHESGTLGELPPGTGVGTSMCPPRVPRLSSEHWVS